jgi:hypothetical protein
MARLGKIKVTFIEDDGTEHQLCTVRIIVDEIRHEHPATEVNFKFAKPKELSNGY